MINKDFRFNFSLIALLVYEIALIVLYLDGVSIQKLFFTGLIWASIFIAVDEFITKKNRIRKIIPSAAYFLLIVLLVWNIFNVVRSLINGDGSVTTTLGNVAAGLALIVPFVIVFAFEIRNVKIIHAFYIKVLKFSIPCFFILILVFGTGLSSQQLRALLVLFLPVAFLIPVLPYLTKRDRILVIISAVLLFYIASKHSVRTMMIREILLFISLFAVFIYSKTKQRLILVLSCLILLIPVFLLQQSYVTGQSAFDTYLASSSDDSDLSTDTRTFLYTELLSDLSETNKMTIGKGANGTYYSDYFSSVDEGETHDRNNLEVGILGILLKGGLVAVFLNLALLIIAIYVAFFKSANLYTVSVGYMLLIHTFLLFLENYIVYSGYNFAIWFFMGVCLSKKVRSMTNKEIKMLIQGKSKNHLRYASRK